MSSEASIASLVGRSSLVYKGKDHRWPEYVGLEMELEMPEDESTDPDSDDYTPVPSLVGWSIHADASLRNGVEYVFSAPKASIDIDKSLNSYYSNSRVQTFNGGPRTSTHIHLNMLDATVPQLQSMIVLVYAIESALYNVIGEGRKWAGYSAALEEMPTTRLRNFLRSGGDPHTVLDAIENSRRQDRYYGFNLKSISQHGTVEFRYFFGAPEQHELESWLDLVVGLKKIAKSTTIAEMKEIVNSEEALVEVLKRGLTDEWIAKLQAAVPAGVMYADFLSCISVCAGEDEIDISQDLLQLKPRLVEYLKANKKTEEGKAKIDNLSKQYPVLSYNNLELFLTQVERNEQIANEKAKTAAPTVPAGAAASASTVQDVREVFDWEQIGRANAAVRPELRRLFQNYTAQLFEGDADSPTPTAQVEVETDSEPEYTDEDDEDLY